MIPLYIKPLPLGPMQNLVYLIGDPKTKQAAVVDPAWNVPAILKALSDDGYRLTHIILSHGHYDHVNGVEDLLAQTDATVCAQAVELDHFIPSGAGGLVIPRSNLKKTVSTENLKVGDLEIQLLHTPGHTPGSQCVLVKDAEMDHLWTGDTLFVGTCGRCDLPLSKPEDLFNSLQKIKKLRPETTFYPGHDYGGTLTNTLAKETQTNPFLLCSTRDQFLSMVSH